MIVYQPIVSATPAQLEKYAPWLRLAQEWAEDNNCEYRGTCPDSQMGFVWPCSEKDYAIFRLMSTVPHVLCLDWDLEILPGFAVGGDGIWVGDDHCALVYNGADMLTFAKILTMWDEYRARVPTWAQERNRGWKLMNQFLREHPEVQCNQIPRSTYIHHCGEVR
jgi:hypothetical protein